MEPRCRRSNIKEVEIGYFIIPRSPLKFMLSVFSKMCNKVFFLNKYESKAQPKQLHAMAT